MRRTLVVGVAVCATLLGVSAPASGVPDRVPGKPVKPAKIASTSILGWDTPESTVNAGSATTKYVRVLTGTKGASRTLELWQVDPATGLWARESKARTDDRGRAIIEVPTDTPGTFTYQLRVPSVARVSKLQPGARAAWTTSRVVNVLPVASPPTADDLRSHLPKTPPVGATRVWAVGDIGWAGSPGIAKVASLFANDANPIVLLGDIAYPAGTTEDFATAFDPWYGPLKDRLLAVPGNHDYRSGGDAYFSYFGAKVGSKSEPWYTARIGSWTFLMLNSNCSLDAAVVCTPGSAEMEWLKTQLSLITTKCVAAVWHHPLVSSGETLRNGTVDPMFDLLADAGVDILLAGHEHFYERFTRLDAKTEASPTGVRQFIVGTGGGELKGVKKVGPFSEQRVVNQYGALKLDLSPTGYAWEFVGTDTSETLDYGTDTCTP